jgi:hypothetical protein
VVASGVVARMSRWVRRHGRWGVVVGVIVVLTALPATVAALPAGQTSIDAGQLLRRIQASANVAYSGYAESSGTLALPVTGQFTSVDDLLSGTTQLRVWSRGSLDWRVDTITAFGETDLHATSQGLWTWDYESDTATLDTGDQTPPARLPRADDLVPDNLARRLLSGASAASVSRLPDKRIAGHDAAGLRLQPSGDHATQSTIDHLDVWALPNSGLALQVAIYAKGSTASVLTTSILDLSMTAPAASTIAFMAPPGAHIQTEQEPDVVAFINGFAPGPPPATVAGLDLVPTATGAVGLYGQGVTSLVAVPMPFGFARSLRGELQKAIGAPSSDNSVAIGIGALNLLLTAPNNGSSWLLVGTVTAKTLTAAAIGLPALRFGRR